MVLVLSGCLDSVPLPSARLNTVPRHNTNTCLGKMPRPNACLYTVTRPSACLDTVPQASAMTYLGKGPRPSACLDMVPRPSTTARHGASA